tara:strand:- start:48 stop:404 length:357 start_codon:yes stop_codon:yes gene_type:complete
MDAYKDYVVLCAKIKDLEAEKKMLKNTIVRAMNDNNEQKITTEDFILSKSDRVKVTYDEKGLQAFLFDKGLDVQLFTSVTLDMSKVEYLVANGDISPEELMKYAKVTEYVTLTAKEQR